jgi:hypothetical protein
MYYIARTGAIGLAIYIARTGAIALAIYGTFLGIKVLRVLTKVSISIFATSY